MTHAAIIPPFERALDALSAILGKAEAHCAAHKIDPQVLLGFRLFPDMLAFTRQVQLTCDFAARSAARLSGAEVPSFPDSETSFAELKTRIATVKAYLATFAPTAFEGADSREITLKFGPTEMKMSGLQFRTSFANPNFFFHMSTAYNILRHNGVVLGKADFMGA